MATKSDIKYYSSLKIKKFRKSENKFLAEGKRLVEEGIKSELKCLQVLLTKHFSESEENFITSLLKRNVPINIIPSSSFSKLTTTKNPQGIVAVFEKPEIRNVETEDRIVIGLENISDPGNLGTILRSCDWFGIKNVLVSENSAELFNPKVVRASMGAIFHLNIFLSGNFYDNISQLKKKGYKLLYADMNGEDFRKGSYSNKSVLIFCNEAFGPSKELKNICDKAITIPKKGNIDSLNVAAAAAIVLSEVTS